MIASINICSLLWKFWASKNGRCFVIRIHMEVLLCIGLGRSDRVKPRFDVTQSGSLYFGFMQSLNVSKSSNSGGAPVMKFEPTPKQYRIAFNFGRITARSKGLYGIVDPTIEKIWETFALRDFASWECGWSLAQISCVWNSSELANTPRLFKVARFLPVVLAELRMQHARCNWLKPWAMNKGSSNWPS